MSIRNIITENIILPLSDLVLGHSINKHLRFLLKSQYWTKDEIDYYQNRQLRKLIFHSYNYVEYYRELFDKLGLKPDDIKSKNDLHKIPILTKEDIKREGLDKFIYGNLICSILKKAKWLNVPGSFSKNHWINKGLLPQKINLLHSTINTDIFVNTHNNKEYDFIYLGRLAWEKNIEIIIDAFKTISSEIHNPKLVIVGNGPEKKKLEEYVKINSLENRVVFAGFQKDVTHWLNKARFFVMASVTEAMPTALMQAMSCELICISSNVGNITDLLEHNKNGFLFESGNQSELSDIMSYCISNTESISKIGTQAREDVILNHSYHTAIKKWDELFKNA